MIGEVVGGIQRRHERERALGRVALRLVGDVVEDQAVQTERAQTPGGHGGDLPHLFGFRRQTRWCEGEEQKLAVTGLDAADEIHGRHRTGGSGLRPRPFACRREHSSDCRFEAEGEASCGTPRTSPFHAKQQLRSPQIARCCVRLDLMAAGSRASLSLCATSGSPLASIYVATTCDDLAA